MNKRPYQNLIAWKEAHQLCLRVYSLTGEFPSEEKFGLTSQMRRSSYGVPTNIAEGNGRKTKRDRSHFLDIATGSIEELHYQYVLSHDLGYLTTQECEELHDRIQRTGYLIHKLQQSL
ncbi:MAG: four helix bundle protein [Patescibacteria group bacterium]